MKYGTTKRREKEIRRLARIIIESPALYARDGYLGISNLLVARQFYEKDQSRKYERWLMLSQHEVERNARRIARKRLGYEQSHDFFR